MNADYKIIGNKILIQLTLAPKLNEAKEGDLLQPQFKAFETEGGKPSAKLNENEYLYKGTILQIPKGAEEYITEHIKEELKLGDIVWVNPMSLRESSVFLPTRQGKVISSEGHFRIHPSEIEAIEINK